MRFETVLFDLDGTLIDSGDLILASFRHATRTVLGRTIPDDGADGERRRPRDPGPDAGVRRGARRRARARLPRAQHGIYDERSHAFTGIEDGAEQLQNEGADARRRDGEGPADGGRDLRRAARRRYFETVVTGDERSATSRIPSRCCWRSSASAPRPRRRRTSGDSPFDIRAAKAAGWPPIAVGWGGIHPARAPRGRERPTSFVGRAGGALGCPLTASRPASRSCAAELEHHNYRYHVLDDARDLRRRVRQALRRARSGSRRRIRSSGAPDSPTARVGAPPSDRFRKVEHLTPMGSLEKVTTDEALREVGRRRPQAARLGRAGRLRDGAEDRRLGDIAPLRGRRLRARRDARRRHPRRGRDGEPADDQGDPAALRVADGEAPAGGSSRSAARCTCRCPAFRRFTERQVARGQGARAEPAQRRRRLGAAARPDDHRRSGRSPSGSTASASARVSRSRRSGRRWSGCASPASARTRSRSGTSRSRRSHAVVRRVGDGAGSSSTTRSTAS